MSLDALIIYSPEHAFVIHPVVDVQIMWIFSRKGRKNMNYFLSGSSHFVTIPFLSLKGDEKF